MREIKFRGKRVDNGEWAYGGYHFEHGFAKTNEKHYITYFGTFGSFCSNEFIQVIPETVGQFTGLKDKNGKEIYEGDVVTLVLTETHKYKGDIFYEDYDFRLRGDSPYRFFFSENQDKMEVIGNIHEVKE